MRRAFAAGLAAIAIVLAGLVYARLFAGGPVSVLPGGALSGEVQAPPGDWSFARDHHYVDVESRARALPYSRTEWFMLREGRLHLLLPSLFGLEEEMKARLDADPDVRVRLDGQREVYEQRAVRVDSPDELDALLAPMIRRQFAMEVSGLRAVEDSPVTMWIYRLEDR